MKKPFCIAAAVSLLASHTATAQVSEDGMGKIVPVELFACSFNEGKGQADLNTVITRWNAFMDERDVDDYAAWQLTPYYYGPEQEFDLLWMGASTDGETMGRGSHLWVTEGGDVAAGFNDVMHCMAHLGLASAMYKAPPDGATPATSVMTMSDCSMNEGTRYSDVRSAEMEWAAYQVESGVESGTWHWFPNYGGGNQDFDYKLVNAYADFTALGATWENTANRGGREVSDEVFGELDECDDARVYVATSIRSAQLRK